MVGSRCLRPEYHLVHTLPKIPLPWDSTFDYSGTATPAFSYTVKKKEKEKKKKKSSWCLLGGLLTYFKTQLSIRFPNLHENYPYSDRL